jgi:hypothetical protein
LAQARSHLLTVILRCLRSRSFSSRFYRQSSGSVLEGDSRQRKRSRGDELLQLRSKRWLLQFFVEVREEVAVRDGADLRLLKFRHDAGLAALLRLRGGTTIKEAESGGIFLTRLACASSCLTADNDG